MAKNVRMADIAEKLGISIVSVSKGLSGKEGVSDEMRAKIIATAKEMGYEPASKTEKPELPAVTIGILTAESFFDEYSFYSKLYRAVLKRCNALGYSCLLELVSPESEKNCIMPPIITNRKVDALIFMGEISRRFLSTAIRGGLPFLLLDFYDDQISADSVLSDNTSGAYMVTQHLLSTGRRRIAFVGSICATSSIMDRYLGYCRALLHAGIEPRADWRIEDRDSQNKLLPLMLPNDMPDAFVCNCDEVAFNLVEQLRRRGYKIPDDIAVTGYDDHRFSTLCIPQLTSYRVDVDSMAASAVSQLQRKLKHKPVLSPTVIVPGALVCRDSTRTTS